MREKVPVGLAQQILLHLAHDVARQFGGDDHPFGDLEGRDSGFQRGDDAAGIERLPRLGNDDGDDALAEVRMGHADHGAFGHPR